MGQLVFQATLGGQVALSGPNTASSYTLNLPTVNGNVVSTGDTATVTNTMLATNVYTAPGTIGSGTANTGAFTTLTASTSVLSPIHGSASGSLSLQSAGTTAVTIDTSQNVGIGTTSPTSKLTVAGEIRSLDGTVSSYFTNANGAGGYIGTRSNDYLSFQTNATDRMRINSAGRWMVNVTTPLNGTTARGSLVFDSTSEQGLFIATSVATSGQCMGFNYNISTNVGSINITSSATSYATSSDYRLKENIVPMIGALDKVALLKPVTYTWKIDNSAGQGFIAHELQAIIPDCVSGEKDAVNKDGSIKPQQIDTSFLVATLTAAIQEQQALITSLTARIETLEIAQPKTTTS